MTVNSDIEYNDLNSNNLSMDTAILHLEDLERKIDDFIKSTSQPIKAATLNSQLIEREDIRYLNTVQIDGGELESQIAQLDSAVTDETGKTLIGLNRKLIEFIEALDKHAKASAQNAVKEYTSNAIRGVVESIEQTMNSPLSPIIEGISNLKAKSDELLTDVTNCASSIQKQDYVQAVDQGVTILENNPYLVQLIPGSAIVSAIAVAAKKMVVMGKLATIMPEVLTSLEQGNCDINQLRSISKILSNYTSNYLNDLNPERAILQTLMATNKSARALEF